jgi:hypothetical protein
MSLWGGGNLISSSAIYTDIVSCEAEINALHIVIIQLQKKIEDQEMAISGFIQYGDNYSDEFTDRKQRCKILEITILKLYLRNVLKQKLLMK